MSNHEVTSEDAEEEGIIEQDDEVGARSSCSSEQRGTEGNLKGSGVVASAVNIANNALGSGLLALPFAFKEASVVWAVVLVACCLTASVYSFVLLARCCDMLEVYNYRALGERAGGRGFSVFVQVVMVLYTSGTCISYNVLLGDFLPAAAANVPEGAVPPWALGLLRSRTHCMLLVGGLVLLPLSTVKTLHSLRYTSMLALACMAYMVAVIVVRYGQQGWPLPGHAAADAKWEEASPAAVLAFPIVSLAFTTHYNAPQYYKELRVQTPEVMRRAAAPGLAATGLVYIVAGACGYLTFGQSTSGDIVLNYSHDDPLVFWARLALACTITLSYPLVFNSLRSNVRGLVSTWRLRGKGEEGACAPPGTSEEPGSPAREPLLGAEGGGGAAAGVGAGVDDGPTSAECLAYSAVLVPLHVAAGVALPRLEVILGFNGSIFGTLIVYILPPVMYIRVKRAPIYCAGMPSVALLCAGVGLGVSGVVANVVRLCGGLKHATAALLCAGVGLGLSGVVANVVRLCGGSGGGVGRSRGTAVGNVTDHT